MHGAANAMIWPMEQVTDPLERLAAIRDLTAKAMRGETTHERAFDALGIVAAECGLTQKMADDVIDGFALDAEDWRPRSEDDLYRYCFHVAGAVGVMMAVVMGVRADDNATLDRACDLGLAFQLANIARDLNEDDAAGRCYLPQEWLSDMDIPPGQTLSPHYRGRLASLAKRLCDASEQYEASARVGAASLPFRSRWAVLAAAGIYGDIARQVRAKGSHAWDSRVFTSSSDKLVWAAKAGVMALGNTPEVVSRDGMWTRVR
jgi:15-cis-phytoene synthase